MFSKIPAWLLATFGILLILTIYEINEKAGWFAFAGIMLLAGFNIYTGAWLGGDIKEG